MKNGGDWSLRLLATALFVGSSAGMLFAAGSPGDEHAGYQGIPVRNGLNRGLIQHDGILAGQRYPSLPRRKNETELPQPASVDARNQKGQNSDAPDRGGYAGIPQRSGLNASKTQENESASASEAQRAGYGGIPQQIAADSVTQHTSTFSTKRASALARSK